MSTVTDVGARMLAVARRMVDARHDAVHAPVLSAPFLQQSNRRGRQFATCNKGKASRSCPFEEQESSDGLQRSFLLCGG